MKKKLIVVFLSCFIFIFSSFALFVTDLQSIFQTILQTMEQAEQFTSTLQKWQEDLHYYEQQYQQMVQYYEQLKGLAEKWTDGSFTDIWNQTKEILTKSIQITNTTATFESKITDTTLKLLNSHSQAVNYINSFYTPDNPFSKKINAIYNNFSDSAVWYADTFTLSYSTASEAYKTLQANLAGKKNMYTQLIAVNNEAIAELESKMNNLIENYVVTNELITETMNSKNILEESKKTLQKNFLELNLQIETEIKNNTLTDASREEYNLMQLDYQNQLDILEKEINTLTQQINELDIIKNTIASDYSTYGTTKQIYEKENDGYNYQLSLLGK